MKIRQISAALISVLLILTAGLISCGTKGASPDPNEISSMTGGTILRTDSIEVRFVREQDISLPAPQDAIRLRPAVKGSVFWQDAYTLVFAPSEPLKAGERYTAMVGSKAAGISSFSFNFNTQLPLIEVSIDPVQIDDDGYVLITGTLKVDEDTPFSQIEKIVTSSELVKPSWNHEDDVHRFTFYPVSRGDASRTVEITWTGTPVGSKEHGYTSVLVPGSASFDMVNLSQDSGILVVTFSAPLKAYKDLRGFISLGGDTNVRYSLDGNVVKIYGKSGGDGIPPGTELFIQDLEDVNGNVLVRPVQYTVSDKWELPEIRFTGSGTILPSSQGSAMVVETRNVTGVLVEAFHIYGNNMTQFLQVNNLNGERELTRVGEPVFTKSYDFSWKDSDKNRWLRRGLDLSELSSKYPDGMFRIRVTFRKHHIKYECSAGHGDFSNLEFPGDSFPAYSGASDESSYWNNYENSAGYSWYEWNRYRNDPCHPAFYMNFGSHNITIGRNVLVSDLGLIAKRSLDGTWLAAASNIKTAQPAANTDIKVLNYQGRLLYQVKTGANGMAALPNMASLSSAGVPSYISAETNFGKAYLKINDSLALASSHFDVSGDKPVDGIRGLIYGERGVWRPGDDIYLSFLLSDPAGTLPREHPVSFELEDPRGVVTMRRTYTSSVDGFYPINAATSSDAPTGDWNARVRVGGSVFNKYIKIETVMPNRLKMDLDFGAGDFLTSNRTLVELEAAWLYGAPAPGLKSDISVTFGDKETVFNTYTDYSFRDPSRIVSSERQTLWEGTLDDAGKASFVAEMQGGPSVPGKLNARILTRVFEPSGVFSSEQIVKEFSPYERYVGLKLPKGDAARNMLLTDTEHKADIVLLDGNGKPVQDSIVLNCAVYKMNWRWWWEKGGSESAEFASALSRTPIMQGTVTSSGGKASWNFQVKYPDWGRYIVIVRDKDGGHSAAQVVYIDWPGWAGRAQEGGQGSSAMLNVTAGKGVYNAGEKITVNFPSNKDAVALAVVEKGGQVIKSEWFNCKDTQTSYEFQADPTMVPNVYVHITLLQPHLQTANDLPIRLYGILPVMVEDPRTKLQPQITAPDNWTPESTVSFTVSEAGGRPMVYTVAVVDEGLLGLTRYSLPNPANTFYSKEASFLKAWDLYSDIMGAYSGQLETLLAIGGGDDMFDDSAKETQRFKPVVRFFGPFELKAGEKRSETFELPPYIGALRIMTLAASSSKEDNPVKSRRAYGTTEKSVRVSSDLMVFGSLPRTLSPGDEAEIPVYVNSYSAGAKTVKVSLSAPGVSIDGTNSQNITFDKPGEKLVRFKVKAPDLPGWLKFSISAESTGLRTAHHVTDLEVRSTAVPVTISSQGLITANDSWKGSLNYPGVAGSNKGVIELSRFPPLNLEKRLDYLVSYPHGCVEQTTSAVFPQLYLDRIMQLDTLRTAEIQTNITAGIEKLQGFQTSSGGFSYWPGGGEAHSWGSSYAGHFLLEAKRAGYGVSESMMKKWLHYQKDRAISWQSRNGNSLEQAYRLYTIALSGEADLGSMNRLREQRDLDPEASWRLAAAYWYAGQRDTARSMVKALTIPQKAYRDLSGNFGSNLRDKAMILETLMLLGDGGRTRPLFEELSAALAAETWLSTQETAYALIAMVPYMQGPGNTGVLTLDYVLSGGQSRSISFDTPMVQVDLGTLAGTSGSITVNSRSAAPVYSRFTVKGLPAEGAEPSLSEGLSLSVEYRDSQGKTINPNAVKVGDDMEVRVTVKNSYTQAVPEIALVHPIPASWELINTRFADGSSSSSYKYQDIRDDRVMTYFDLPRGSEKTVSFRVNKTYTGNYYRPAIHAYAMYDESIRALIPGVR